jgi:hypothetical protein
MNALPLLISSKLAASFNNSPVSWNAKLTLCRQTQEYRAESRLPPRFPISVVARVVCKLTNYSMQVHWIVSITKIILSLPFTLHKTF